MSRPVFLSDDLDTGPLVLRGAEGRHAATVRRLRVGEQVDVVDGRGARALCTVTAIGRDVVELDVVDRVQEPAAQPRLVLVQALAKGDRGELAVELATEVGIDEVVPWAAERCVVRWEGSRGDRALERWRSTGREAGKQSRRARLPVVSPLAGTREVLDRVRASSAAMVLHEAAEVPLASVPLPVGGDVVLVVGPEGGLTDAELDALVAAGGTAVRLGRSVLRASSAGAVAAAVVSARTPRWA
jgi:16S rRNA (uracil1498-N3)-methyltransferase